MKILRFFFLSVLCSLSAGEIDVHAAGDTATKDFVSPEMTSEAPGPGRRVRQTAAEYKGTDVYHALYLPTNWKPGGKFPVIVEYTGNKHPPCGSSGEVKDANLGFGLSGGRDFIWVSMPYIEKGCKENALHWWGDRDATIDYCKTNLPRICKQFGGDPKNVLICGFSRGAIAASYIGLADDEIAAFWRAMVTHDHFDGDTPWNYPESDRKSALARLARLNGRPVLVCGGANDFLREHPDLAQFTFLRPPVAQIFDIPEGKVIHPHTDLWMHRESRYRDQARAWLAEVMAPIAGQDGAAPSASNGAAAQETSVIRLKELSGRTWLVDASGRPFFAHGVTHIAGNHGEDVTAVAEACKDLGFNAYGYGCPNKLKTDLPYLEGRQFVPMSLYRVTDGSFGFVDIFDPEVQSKLVEEVRKVCLANRANPHLIGYCWTDLGAWPLENATGKNWVGFIRDLPADSAGQKAYRDFLEAWQGDEPRARDLAFLRIIAREYFRVLGTANREFDPNHLIFGDRFTFATAIPEVVEEMLPYVDAIAIQPRFNPGFPGKDFDRIHKLTGKPIIICDFAIRFKEEGKNIRGWKPEESPKLAGERYADYLREAIATPYIIGAFWCNPINSRPGFKKGGIKQGLFERGLTPRPELNQAIRALNKFLDQAAAEK